MFLNSFESCIVNLKGHYQYKDFKNTGFLTLFAYCPSLNGYILDINKKIVLSGKQKEKYPFKFQRPTLHQVSLSRMSVNKLTKTLQGFTCKVLIHERLFAVDFAAYPLGQ